MVGLRESEALLNSLPEGEKAPILKWAVEELSGAFPGIDSRPEVCGGEPSLIRTPIPVWILEQARRLGATDQTLLTNYPTLCAEDLQNACVRTSPRQRDRQSNLRKRVSRSGFDLNEREDRAASTECTPATGARRVDVVRGGKR